ncbi:hypothetical protein MY8738_006864 [Beauveria namnaoensis]
MHELSETPCAYFNIIIVKHTPSHVALNKNSAIGIRDVNTRNVLDLQVVLDMPPTDVKVLQMLRSFDFGGMIGSIGVRKHFKGVKAAFSAVEGFGMGYGPVSDALAF